GAAAAQAQYGPQPTAPPQTSAPRAEAAPAAQPAPGERQYNLSRREQTAMQPLLTAAGASDWPAVQAALPAAIEAARGNDAKYIIGQVRLRMGIQLNDRAIQSQAIDELIASGGALPAEMRGLLENQLDFATAAGDTAKAARAQARLDALNPNDPERFVRQARIRAQANDAPGAIAFYRQAMQQVQSAGQPIPPEWRRQIAALAYSAHLPETNTYMREFVTAAPSPGAWHDTLALLAELGAADDALKLDIYRLMRAAGAMQAEHDYVQLGEAANTARITGEVHAVYQEGLSRNLITTNAEIARQRVQVSGSRLAEDRASLAGERAGALSGGDGRAALRLGDAYFGYGDYRVAADLYRAALGKSGVDAATANTRLGAALALSGDRAGAETALRAVSGGGTRGELAQYWLLWLSQRGAGA
ncbi:MAG TPA: hypothetical protein VLK25_10510, partial [Allosphingosinicella sp.]|nr:hypothetical protein [Allosphingosinicella sp.]